MNAGVSRRSFLRSSGAAIGGAMFAGGKAYGAPRTDPADYTIVEGHRDIWEFSDRLKLKNPEQHSPLKNFLLPRLMNGGPSVVIMPGGGDSLDERAGRDNLLEGALRVTDMLLSEIEKTDGKASIIRTRTDVPSAPNKNKVQFFLDMEGGGAIQIDPEPGYEPERRLALLRDFFRLGVRGVQLTHNGRNMLADGVGGGKWGNRLSDFGVEVIQEMNRLGMMVGVSHLCANGVLHAAQVSKTPIVSTHQNVNPFLKSQLELVPEEVKAIASTGGIIGLRYISEATTPYSLLADEVESLAKSVGVEHIGIGWLGHDKGHPQTGYVPGVSPAREFHGVESQSVREHYAALIKILADRGFTEQQIGLILGGNYLRIWRQILPAA